MIDEKVLGKMFVLVGMDKKKMHESLCQLGRPPDKCKDIWSPQRPTTGYCYVVTEVASYFMKKHSVPHKTYRLDLGNDESHWFVRLGKEGDGEIIDLTADQTDEDYDYENAERKEPYINQHSRTRMSDRAEELARMMNLL